MSYILALDQGTTSSRALVFDASGNVRGGAQKEFRQIFPQPGWVEHDPREILASQTGVAAEALTKAGIGARDVAAIGITNQRETTVVWDRASGEPIHNAIVWQDRRTARHCDELRAAGMEPLFTGKTGLVLDAYFSGTKLHWILANVPGAREKARAGRLAFGTIDTWLIWHLSGRKTHYTDTSNASRTLLYNIHEGCWDEELLEILDIPASVLPEVGPSSGKFAQTDGDLFAGNIPIAGVAGDQQAALFGQCCFEPGMVKNTYGTGCFMLLNTGARPKASRNRLLTTAAWTRGRVSLFALEGSVFVAGAAVQWLRDGLGIIRSSAEVEPLAASVPDSGGVYFVPAFTGLGSPHWDPYARGTLLGLTRGSTRAHIARATLDGIAYQVTDILAAMQADAGLPVTQLRVDGGAAANNLLMQFQADLMGVPVVRPRHLESTAQGAAYLAGLAVGTWKDEAEIAALWKAERTFEPAMGEDQREGLLAGWKKALERAKGWQKQD